MAKNVKRVYKRSEDAPIMMTEQHKKDAHALEVTSNIIKYALIAVVLLSIIFSMLALVTPSVSDPQLDTVASGKDKFVNISSFDLISGWYATSGFTNANRGIYIGKQFQHAFDYIVDRVPALQTAAKTGIGGDEIFKKITPEQDKMLDIAYIAMLAIEIVSLVWLIVMAIVFILSFVKKIAPKQGVINAVSIVHIVLTLVMFIFTLALSSNSTAEFTLSVGVGMWLNVLVAVLLQCVLIANAIYKAKVKSHESLALSLRS